MSESKAILYSMPVSSFAFKARLVIAVKGLPVEIRNLEHGDPLIASIWPLGFIPILKHGDLTTGEADVIVQYLDEAFPEFKPQLVPESAADKARSRLYCRFHDLYVDPPLRALFGYLNPKDSDLPFVVEKLELLKTRLQQLDKILDARPPAPFLVGKELTLADLAFPATLAVMDAMGPLLAKKAKIEPPKLSPRLQAWRETVEANPIVKGLVEEYKKHLNDWVSSSS